MGKRGKRGQHQFSFCLKGKKGKEGSKEKGGPESAHVAKRKTGTWPNKEHVLFLAPSRAREKKEKKKKKKKKKKNKKKKKKKNKKKKKQRQKTKKRKKKKIKKKGRKRRGGARSPPKETGEHVFSSLPSKRRATSSLNRWKRGRKKGAFIHFLHARRTESSGKKGDPEARGGRALSSPWGKKKENRGDTWKKKKRVTPHRRQKGGKKKKKGKKKAHGKKKKEIGKRSPRSYFLRGSVQIRKKKKENVVTVTEEKEKGGGKKPRKPISFSSILQSQRETQKERRRKKCASRTWGKERKEKKEKGEDLDRTYISGLLKKKEEWGRHPCRSLRIAIGSGSPQSTTRRKRKEGKKERVPRGTSWKHKIRARVSGSIYILNWFVNRGKRKGEKRTRGPWEKKKGGGREDASSLRPSIGRTVG